MSDDTKTRNAYTILETILNSDETKIPTQLCLTETNTYSLFELLLKHPIRLNILYLYMLISAKAVYARSETPVSRETHMTQ